MDSQENIEQRLDAITAVTPLLNALRMMSLGSWRAAQKQHNGVLAYQQRLLSLLPAVLPQLSRPLVRRADRAQRAVVLMIGSERGLCGRFNANVAEFAMTFSAEIAQHFSSVELWVLGKRGLRAIERLGQAADSFNSLPSSKLPPLSLASELSQRWLAEYEMMTLDRVDVVVATRTQTGLTKPKAQPLLPIELPQTALKKPSWPPPIIETDPQRLYSQIVRQWTVLRLYELLLLSAETEHATRYQMMETASQNADSLSDELTLALHSQRQQQITREMQELAVSAGLTG